jgi:cytochrome d ubiquinol oxidase subunit II
LVALIFRAVAIEFRSKRDNRTWRLTWDIGFSAASILGAFLIGVALGNIARGIPLNAEHVFVGTFLGLLHPYSILVGITTVALFMMHGAIYVVMKTEGELQRRITGWINNTIIFFIICYATTTMATLLYVPNMTVNIRANPWLFVVPILNMLAIANIPREVHHQRYFRAFLSSSAAVAALLLLFGINMYPNLVVSHPEVQNSLTIYNAASSTKTLRIMGLIALIGMPVVVAYTSAVYWIFRGKVKLDAHSY